MGGSWGGAPEHSAGEMHHPAWGWDLGGGAGGTQKPADGNGLSRRDQEDGCVRRMERVRCGWERDLRSRRTRVQTSRRK